MGYPITFSDSQKRILNEFIKQLEVLKPGQMLTITHEEATELARRRYLLYAYLSPIHSNTKELYKIITINANNIIVIRKRNTISRIVVSTDECEKFVMEHLLEVDQSDIAWNIIQQKCSEPQKQMQIYEEWARKL